MPRKSLIFLGTEYATQKDFELYVKTLIYNIIGVCDDIKINHPDSFKVLNKILERNPNFNSRKENISTIKLVEDTSNNSLKMFLVYENGHENAISWKCAITGKVKTDKYKLMSALRSSVEDQILKFRRESIQECNFCNSKNNLHVDHIKHFEEIVFEFLEIMKTKNKKIPTFFGETDRNRKCFLENDSEIQTLWNEYHKREATLRMLCQSCNLKRPKTSKIFRNNMMF